MNTSKQDYMLEPLALTHSTANSMYQASINLMQAYVLKYLSQGYELAETLKPNDIYVGIAERLEQYKLSELSMQHVKFESESHMHQLTSEGLLIKIDVAVSKETTQGVH